MLSNQTNQRLHHHHHLHPILRKDSLSKQKFNNKKKAGLNHLAITPFQKKEAYPLLLHHLLQKTLLKLTIPNMKKSLPIKEDLCRQNKILNLTIKEEESHLHLLPLAIKFIKMLGKSNQIQSIDLCHQL